MLSFSDFIALTNFNRKAANSRTARDIYCNVIWRDDVRIGFVDKSNASLPALAHCAEEIERICSAPSSDFFLTNDTAKQIIGRMVSVSIEPFGYTPLRKARMPKNMNLTFIKNAHVFGYTGGEVQRIERCIADI